MADDLLSDRIETRLASMRTAEGVDHWCSELYVNGSLIDASDWTVHVVDAIRAGRDLDLSARSDLAYREARYEARALFTHAA